MKRPIQVFNYTIKNQSDGSVDIYIDGDIVDASTQAILESWFGDSTSTSFKSFRNALNKTEAQTYNIIINSPGGHVGDALAMHDLLVEMQDKGKVVNTKGIGIVASAATFILLASKNPEMTKNSYFMIHNVSGGIWGSVDQVESYAATMRKFNNSARDLYAEISGKRKEDISKLMDKETWMTAQEAKDGGFIKTITGSQNFTNKLDPEKWMYADTAILNSYNKQIPETNQFEDMKQFFANWGKSIMDAINGIKPKDDNEKALLNNVATTLKAQFESMGEGMEAALKDHIKNMKLTASIDDTTEKRIKDLEDANQELNTQIENLVGGETTDGGKGKEKDYKMKGSFSK